MYLVWQGVIILEKYTAKYYITNVISILYFKFLSVAAVNTVHTGAKMDDTRCVFHQSNGKDLCVWEWPVWEWPVCDSLHSTIFEC